MGRIFGYIRVSSKDQNEARQIDEIRPLVTDPQHDIFIDKQSGKDFDRPQYQLLKGACLRDGDTLIIKSLDRLGRNYDQIKEEWKDLCDRGISIRVLDFPLLNTDEYEKDNLMRRFLSNIVLEVLSFVAENERTNIRQRQREGIDAAKRRGVQFGRRVVKPEGFEETVARWQAGEMTAVAAMNELGMKKSSFYKRVREMKATPTTSQREKTQ